MSSPSDPWLGVVLVVLFALLLFLRVKFPSVSRGTETAALAMTILLFFLVCHVFVNTARIANSAGRSDHSDSGRVLKR